MKRQTAASAVVAMVTLGVVACVGAAVHLRTLRLLQLTRTGEPSLASLWLNAHQEGTAWSHGLLMLVLLLLPAMAHRVITPRAGSGWGVAAAVSPLLLVASMAVTAWVPSETGVLAGALLALGADAAALVVALWGGTAARIQLELLRARPA